MARSWQDIRAEAVQSGKVDEVRVAAARRHVERAQAVHKLAELRKELGMLRQVEIAEVMGVSQARVSKIERGDLGRTELGTLQAYVAALGGELRVSVELGDGESIVLEQEPA
ncbi:helix-turn-helix domain-containing protein [Tsukamurella pseudospumae]|uniref:XRE family transcriptional regulator n=1 Tax=Tsukamurella pseudospumae TaxID=239498 RepID=A0A138A169_9ACTN|nr:helix-turn-helix domain-containing protein [Tsukamurella pseudospumae]KXO98029.1 XRE family transcriptional regulator [Tsukamurella pseudospumae]KXP04170.1 XRE family transcriptional regulator [Tsukamurella pseudospumae]